MTFQTIGGNGLTHLEFLDRFTDVEIMSIRAAAKEIPEVDAWLYRFDKSTVVDVSDPRTISGVQALEAIGLLNTGRAAEILA